MPEKRLRGVQMFHNSPGYYQTPTESSRERDFFGGVGKQTNIGIRGFDLIAPEKYPDK